MAATQLPAAFRAASIWLLCCSLLASLARTSGSMNLPDGIENILGFVPRSTFKCERDGYFGDIDNDCRLFHLCQRQLGPGGRVEWRHWTYACGNQTMFNQLTLTCAFVDEAIPCRHASQFQYLNEVIHKPAEPFLTDADVTSGFSYYSNRIMSDGARQRAFEDSHLLAQIGGQQQQQQQQQHSTAQAQPQATFTKPPASNSAPEFASNQLNSLTFNSFAEDQLNQAINQWSANNFAPAGPSAQQQDQLPAEHKQFGQTSRNQDQVDLVGHHSFKFQNQPAASQLNQPADNQPATSNNQRQQFESNGAFALASSDERQTFSAPTTTTSTTSTSPADTNQNNNQQSQFEYSITTNHQANAPSEPANVIFRQQLQQLHQLQHQHQRQADQPNPRQFEPTASPTVATTFTTPTAAAATVPPTTPATTEPTQPATSARQHSQASPSSTTPDPLFAPTFTASQRLKPTQVTTLVTPSPSTTTSLPLAQTQQQPTQGSSTAKPPPELRQKRRPNSGSTQSQSGGSSSNSSNHNNNNSSSNNNSSQQAPAPRRTSSTANSSGRLLRAGFQSSRISGQQTQKRQAESTPIVMRKNQRQEAASGASLSSSSSLVSPLETGQVLPWSVGGDFWRRSFDSQLMAPKFESLLLRRRV